MATTDTISISDADFVRGVAEAISVSPLSGFSADDIDDVVARYQSPGADSNAWHAAIDGLLTEASRESFLAATAENRCEVLRAEVGNPDSTARSVLAMVLMGQPGRLVTMDSVTI